VVDSFPRQYARTVGYNLGLPRNFTVASDGSRVVFTRSPAGDDPLACLWVYDVAADRERLVFDPATGGGEGHISDEERDRRERARERLTGVVGYTANHAARIASFAVGERLFVADLASGGPDAVTELKPAGPAFDPRPDPTGRRVAYVTRGDLRVADLSTATDTLLASDEDPDVHWGLAEFVAAEEMGRLRGYWWGSDGDRLMVARVDDRPLQVWHIASPIDPALPPRAVRYPQAGTANAIVTLHVFGLDGSRVDVEWDLEAFEYLVTVSWEAEGPPLALVQSRDQQTARVLTVDVETGATQTIWEDHDERWIHVTPGTPAWLPGGRLLTAAHRDDTRRLLIDGEPVTPVGLQVESVLDAGSDVMFRATDDPLEMHVWGLFADGELARLTDEPGVHTGTGAGATAVLTSETMSEPLPVSVVTRNGQTIHTFGSFAETPLIAPRPTFFLGGPKELRTAIFTPEGAEPEAPLPVLMSPYGGPHHARVVRASRTHLESQWFADQGFVVVVADGRGTPNRGVEWDQAIYGDLATPPLEDQVDALHAAAERYGFLDLSRVGIRGWSFGGFLTCLAMLRRPDVFHAGIAGAPDTDQRLYDTFYTERYLGTPEEHPEAYERCGVVKDAPNLRGELLIIHGLADDNVYVANSLRLSKALLEAGRRHSFIPLSGITHRPVEPAAAENMLKIEVEFLKRALRMPTSTG
jgi:dipeptidyl-peptidase 4